MRTWAYLLVLQMLLVGCPAGDDDDDSGVGDDDTGGADDDTADDDSSEADDDTAGDPWEDGWPVEVTLDGQVLIEGSFDGGEPIWWAMDTGADITYVDAEIVGSEGATTGDVVIGPLDLPQYDVYSLDLSEAEAYIGWDLGGLMGQDLFSGRFTAIDYKGGEAHFFDEVVEVAPEGVIDGGLLVETHYDLPLSIPVMTVSLSSDAGEVELQLIADTGSGVTLITEDLFDQIDDGTLPRLEGYVWATMYGSDEGFVTRIPWITFGDSAETAIGDSWAVVVPADNHLLPLLRSVGLDCDGFLGFPVYRRFFLGVDGLEDRYLWRAYDGNEHIDFDEWNRVGIEPVEREGEFVVEMVYRPSDAETQGIEVGDVIAGLDGNDLEHWALDNLKQGLRGSVGDTRTLTIRRGEEEMEFVVGIDALLP